MFASGLLMDGMLTQRSTSVNPESELSLFEQILPDEAESMQVVLPRGNKFALTSKKGGSGKQHKVTLSETNAKVYNCTVIPRGRRNMVKEILKYGETAAPAVTHIRGFDLPHVPFEDETLNAIVQERHQRSAFRQERLTRFKAHRYVPALVTERLVPCWRSTDDKAETPAVLAQQKLASIVTSMADRNAQPVKKPAKGFFSRRQYKKKVITLQKCFTPTVSTAMKRAVRGSAHNFDDEDERWQINGKEETRALLHPIVPALDNGGAGPAADELREVKLREDHENRSLWLAHDVKPGGRSPTPAAEEIEALRHSGKSQQRALQAQYEKRREVFQNTPDGGAMKSFRQFCENHKTKEKEAAAEAVKCAAEKAKEQAQPAFSMILSLGIGKPRGTTLLDPGVSEAFVYAFRVKSSRIWAWILRSCQFREILHAGATHRQHAQIIRKPRI